MGSPMGARALVSDYLGGHVGLEHREAVLLEGPDPAEARALEHLVGDEFMVRWRLAVNGGTHMLEVFG